MSIGKSIINWALGMMGSQILLDEVAMERAFIPKSHNTLSQKGKRKRARQRNSSRQR